ncbi:MAG: MBL fold metallo-hydrolase [Candidatus Hecatellaceae archaeon]|nr:MAG: MBL fold hydrolase [Candidatus Hecatellales archaeon]
MRITVVYDNVSMVPGLKPSWGFSAVLQEGSTITLFDTGWDGRLLLSNLKALGFNPSSISTVAISHSHWDHLGGLAALLAVNPEIKVYVPSSFSKNLKREIASRAGMLVEVSKPTPISASLQSLGEFRAGGSLTEQFLLASKNGEVLLLAGCAHPGLEAPLERLERLKVGRLAGVVGGLHGFRSFHLLEGLRLIVPCHCTQYKQEIARLYPQACKPCGIGLTLEF